VSLIPNTGYSFIHDRFFLRRFFRSNIPRFSYFFYPSDQFLLFWIYNAQVSKNELGCEPGSAKMNRQKNEPGCEEKVKMVNLLPFPSTIYN
jgi:hypothetical protein